MFIENLPKELLSYIIDQTKIDNKINIKMNDKINTIKEYRKICKSFKLAINFMTIKIYKFNILFDNILKQDTEAIKRDKCITKDDFINYRDNIKVCTNFNCLSIIQPYNFFGRTMYNPAMLGMTYFFYPKILTKKHDFNVNEFDSPNFEYLQRLNQCRKAKKYRHFIPYCIECMYKYYNLEIRPDGQQVPIGDIEELYEDK